MPILIQLFCRVQDNFKDPNKYIEDLKQIYAQNYQFVELSNNCKTKQIYTNKTYRILFHNYLKKKIIEWYSNLIITIQKN